MRALTLYAFKSKLFKPCRTLLQMFRFKIKRPLFIKSFPFHRNKSANKKYRGKQTRHLLSLSGLSTGTKQVDEIRELERMTESPLSPAYVKTKNKRTGEVKDACQSFENYLVEMLVEDGKVRDLIDVEELLYCWKNLRCPVFVNLVSMFYAELCKDLFSGQEGEGHGFKSRGDIH